jgi:ABC-type antimicrobial peptide transport system permease subunit
MLPFRIGTLLVRATTSFSALQLLEVAQSADTRASYRVRTLDEIYALRHSEARMASSIISSFAVTAFAIAVAGVFGVMTFLVTNRTREIGIRMALGADRRDVRRLVLGSSLRLIIAGVAVGAAGAVLAGRWLESQLFSVTATDAPTYAVVGTTVLVTALAATWFPARRAARVDPAITLRAE